MPLPPSSPLDWPRETGLPSPGQTRLFSQRGSNLVLDFHGDPLRAGLCVFSDGNHHMALETAIQTFLAANPEVIDVFYSTTPPAPLVDALLGGGITIGNLTLSRKPDVFIGPGPILDKLVDAGLMAAHRPFAESRGNVLLVLKGNPKGIAGIADLLSPGVTLALSNPDTEGASYGVYRDTLLGLAGEAGMDTSELKKKISYVGTGTIFSTTIHHREIPELLARGSADVAVVYYHLALRYTRIFPDVFDLISLDGIPNGVRSAANPTTRYHIGLIEDGGRWGRRFKAFMLGDEARLLYKHHGLQRPN